MPSMSEPDPVLTESIREVWKHNLEEEFKVIRKIVNEYPFIAMDTEFPGVVFVPSDQDQERRSMYSYFYLKSNVDALKIIQIGLTFANKDGQLAKPVSTWQFNFKFDLNTDAYAGSSIDLLVKSGIQFDRLYVDGIDPREFGELLTSSGLVLVDGVNWVTFHSSYDFGYLLKILTGSPLPTDLTEFYQLLRLYFVNLYDIKQLMIACNFYRGGLQELADQLEVKRIGRQHQAGSDSRLTGDVYFKMRHQYEKQIDENSIKGLLFGIESD